MNKDVVSTLEDELLSDLLPRMRGARLRMLPVLNGDGVALGLVSTSSIMKYLLPAYVTSGDLTDLSFVPDLNLLREHCKENIHTSVLDLMEDNCLIVEAEDSVLSVAGALIRYGNHELAMVIDENRCLLGIITASDVLHSLMKQMEID